jgi:hypothetical protein
MTAYRDDIRKARPVADARKGCGDTVVTTWGYRRARSAANSPSTERR